MRYPSARRSMPSEFGDAAIAVVDTAAQRNVDSVLEKIRSA